MDAEELVCEIARYAADKKAAEIVELDLRGVLGYTDYFLICSGNTERQTKAIHDGILEGCKHEHEIQPHRVEGLSKRDWILMDYLDVVVHIFTPQTRERAGYGLSRRGCAPRVREQQPLDEHRHAAREHEGSRDRKRAQRDGQREAEQREGEEPGDQPAREPQELVRPALGVGERGEHARDHRERREQPAEPGAKPTGRGGQREHE
jgi:ribosome-associated protein